MAMLKTTTLKIADTTFIRCQGRIVVGEDFAILRSAVLQEASKVVALDLAGVKRIDAGGLGVLLGLRRCAHANAIQFKLMNARPKVERVFRLTKLDRVFEFWSVRDMFDLMRTSGVAKAVGAGGSWLSPNPAA
jgi:anti-sigma B factor antagonist